jgi:uncharacterized membrane protein
VAPSSRRVTRAYSRVQRLDELQNHVAAHKNQRMTRWQKNSKKEIANARKRKELEREVNAEYEPKEESRLEEYDQLIKQYKVTIKQNVNYIYVCWLKVPCQLTLFV